MGADIEAGEPLEVPLYSGRQEDDNPLDQVPYDLITAGWAYNKNVQGCTLSQLNYEADYFRQRDKLESDKLRLKLCVINGSLALMVIVAVMIGALAFHRSFGVFTASNIVAILWFMYGSALYTTRPDTRARIRMSQVYFLLMVFLTFATLVLSVLNIATVSSRIDKFCSKVDCDAHDYPSLKRKAVIASIFGCMFLMWLATYLAHIAFTYICCLQRIAIGSDSTCAASHFHSGLDGFVRAVALVIPNYNRIWRWIKCHVFEPCAHCAHHVFCCEYSENCMFWTFIAAFCIVFLVCLVLCIAKDDTAYGAVSCVIVDIIVEIAGG